MIELLNITATKKYWIAKFVDGLRKAGNGYIVNSMLDDSKAGNQMTNI
jgi:hypothetical protein